MRRSAHSPLPSFPAESGPNAESVQTAPILPAWIRHAATVLVVFFYFALPLSTATTNLIGALLIVLTMMFWHRLRAGLKLLDRSMLVAVLAVPLTAVIGSAVAIYEGHTPWKVLGLHRKELLFIALSLLLLALPVREHARRALWCGTALAVALTIGCWALDRSLTGGPFNPVKPVSMTHAFHNFIVGTVSLWMLAEAVEEDKAIWRRLVLGLASALGLFTVFFVVTGRTGQLSVLMMVLTYAAQRLTRKAAASLTVGTVCVAALLLVVPSAFQERMRQVASDLQAYSDGHVVTSVGVRVLFWKTSLDLIGERPIIGYGTGSFRTVQDERLGISATSDKSAPHPHNDLLHFWVERGVLGLAALLAAYAGLWHAASRLPLQEGSQLRALLVGFFVSGLANAFYLDWASGSFLLAVCALRLSRQRHAVNGLGAPAAVRD